MIVLTAFNEGDPVFLNPNKIMLIVSNDDSGSEVVMDYGVTVEVREDPKLVFELIKIRLN